MGSRTDTGKVIVTDSSLREMDVSPRRDLHPGLDDQRGRQFLPTAARYPNTRVLGSDHHIASQAFRGRAQPRPGRDYLPAGDHNDRLKPGALLARPRRWRPPADEVYYDALVRLEGNPQRHHCDMRLRQPTLPHKSVKNRDRSDHPGLRASGLRFTHALGPPTSFGWSTMMSRSSSLPAA